MCILCGNGVDLLKSTFNSFVMILNSASTFFMDGMCVLALALALATETMRGATLRPLVVILLMSG